MFKATIFTLGLTYYITYDSSDNSSAYYVFFSVKGTRNGETIELKYLKVPIVNSIVEISKIDQ